MLSSIEFQKLGKLLNSLHRCLDIKIALMDELAREIYTASYQTAFCRRLAATPGGYERCVACDHEALEDLRDTKKMKQYRCHAGLIEVALPVTEGGRLIATVLFGQLLDDSPREEQWLKVAKCCDWYPDLNELKQEFMKLKRFSPGQIAACAEVIHACVSEVRLAGIVANAQQDDWHRLLSYLDTYYSTHVTVDALCRELSIGKTRLYHLCKVHAGKTLVEMINERRMDAARELLLTTSQPIQYIAGVVGVSDCNYFTKVFRKYMGMTPGNFRKANHSEKEKP